MSFFIVEAVEFVVDVKQCEDAVNVGMSPAFCEFSSVFLINLVRGTLQESPELFEADVTVLV